MNNQRDQDNDGFVRVLNRKKLKKRKLLSQQQKRLFELRHKSKKGDSMLSRNRFLPLIGLQPEYAVKNQIMEHSSADQGNAEESDYVRCTTLKVMSKRGRERERERERDSESYSSRSVVNSSNTELYNEQRRERDQNDGRGLICCRNQILRYPMKHSKSAAARDIIVTFNNGQKAQFSLHYKFTDEELIGLFKPEKKNISLHYSILLKSQVNNLKKNKYVELHHSLSFYNDIIEWANHDEWGKFKSNTMIKKVCQLIREKFYIKSIQPLIR